MENAMSSPRKLLYSQKEAAAQLGITERALHKLIRSGKIKGERIGRRTLISRREIERFARQALPADGVLRDLRANPPRVTQDDLKQYRSVLRLMGIAQLGVFDCDRQISGLLAIGAGGEPGPLTARLEDGQLVAEDE